MENRFNLVDEPWIPVADKGLVSLRQVFSEPELRGLGGNPVHKLALMKLLLAIAQATVTPENDEQWRAITPAALADSCLTYLTKWHDRFYLYGEKPFLQMPAIQAAKTQGYGAVLADISTGNTTLLSQIQREKPLSDADKALVLLTLMAFALSGKKTDNSIVLSEGYSGKTNAKGKPATSKPGPSVAHMGLLHSHLTGADLHTSLYLNLLTREQVSRMAIYPGGVGTPPWEQMPEGEDCPTARKLKSSIMGRLIPLSRFCLLGDSSLHYSEGLAHAGYKDGGRDPTMAVNGSGKEPRALWVDPEKRPWRELIALLGFIGQEHAQGYQCWQLTLTVDRAREVCPRFGIWSGGLRVSSNAGEQYVSGSDDFVESLVWLDGPQLGEVWFSFLKREMEALDQLAKSLYSSVMAFFREQKVDGAKLAAHATQLFWQLCERDFQTLVAGCDNDEQCRELRLRFSGYLRQAYDHFCPQSTARQLDAWAKYRPNLSGYLKKSVQQEA
ncbi:type I-E CRISPR-associated protein Cse1/CasA [Endozoicomonas atrinae]|uniref:type I-E CRISPR-associated protein Cse1/CasA n=1 Tax=Endozoicomonas atrinae TaxID=1333660 RepID=UPI003AFFEF8F